MSRYSRRKPKPKEKQTERRWESLQPTFSSLPRSSFTTYRGSLYIYLFFYFNGFSLKNMRRWTVDKTRNGGKQNPQETVDCFYLLLPFFPPYCPIGIKNRENQFPAANFALGRSELSNRLLCVKIFLCVNDRWLEDKCRQTKKKYAKGNIRNKTIQSIDLTNKKKSQSVPNSEYRSQGR